MRHPLHPALVHFPIACWTVATAADFASVWYGEPAWLLAGALLAIGCALALPTMLAGLLELSQVPEGGSAMRDVYMHMTIMLLAWALYTCSCVLRLESMQLAAPGATALVLDAVGFVALAAGGWLGGKLVYGHGIGMSRS